MAPSRLFSALYLALAVAPSWSLAAPPKASHSLSMTKESRHHSHRAYPDSVTSSPTFGSIFQTYLTTIYVRDEPYNCILDTGSADFGISGDGSQTCPVYYKGYEEGHCAGGTEIFIGYGTGNWSGISCSDDVRISDVTLKDVTMAVMYKTFDMLDCKEGHNQNCIIGLAYSSLMGPPNNYSKPFFNLFQEQTQIDDVYAMQCCGWTDEDFGEEEEEKEKGKGKKDKKKGQKDAFPEFSHGSLDLGGVETDNFHGEILYSPITRAVYYGVELLDILVGEVSVLPRYNRLVPPIPGEETPKKTMNLTSWDKLTEGRNAVHHGVHNHPQKASLSKGKNLQASPISPAFAQHLHNISSAKYDHNYNYGKYHKVHYNEEEYPPVPETIIDSGTSNIVLTMDAWNATLAELKKQAKVSFPDSVWSGDSCLSRSVRLNEVFPDLTIVLAGEGSQPPVELIVPPCRYFSHAPATQCDSLAQDIEKHQEDWDLSLFANNSRGYTLSLQGMDGQGNIFGQALYEHYYVVHDNTRQRVGFAPIKGCKDASRCQSAYLDWPGVDLQEVYGISPLKRDSSQPLSFAIKFLVVVGVIFLGFVCFRAFAKRSRSSAAQYEPIDSISDSESSRLS